METIATKPQNRSSKPTAKRTTKIQASTGNGASKSQLRIKEAAYYKALVRGFTPGHELDDWLAAEKEENQ
ncbi:MAG TPA: DUF2934 domain-containing protein [Nitrosomonas sp.]|uniref:DUF2934 domain-containing protein n=1 Tax=Nitrosomonas sp. TaxID=42353 RepID=UPI00207E9B51|nr:DUF2934 domain-containing protein [Nitrosomonas sp.]GJL74389.1 MAG: hypothetical protein NMNS02_04950 [Nitrosomonas sp.]HNP25857.1 DUF2934 domain-containing protein [Nitrosomonas sp.]